MCAYARAYVTSMRCNPRIKSGDGHDGGEVIRFPRNARYVPALRAHTFERLRIRNVSLEYSATCHHRYSSPRKAIIES